MKSKKSNKKQSKMKRVFPLLKVSNFMLTNANTKLVVKI